MPGMELLQFHTLLNSSLVEVSAEFDSPPALPQEKKLLYLLVVGIGGRAQGPSRVFGKGKILSPNEIHSTTVLLSSHYPSYYIN